MRTEGRFSGYTEYRYGPISRAMRRRPQPIVIGPRLEGVLGRVMGVLLEGRSSRFQYEAACRHGLRQAFCSEGYGWARSDAEAASIVAAALAEIGAVRPSWEEGQSDHAVSRDYCKHCFAPLDDEHKLGRTNFCSDVCTRSYLASRAYRENENLAGAGLAAYRLIRKERGLECACEECGKTFRALPNRDQRFCSMRCFHASLDRRASLECLHCGEPFKAHIRLGRDPKFCSPECYAEHGRVAQFQKTCGFCGAEFVAKISTATYCCSTCQGAASELRRGVFNPKRVTARVFDHFITMPVNALPRYPRLTAERFDELLAA